MLRGGRPKKRRKNPTNSILGKYNDVFELMVLPELETVEEQIEESSS